MTPREQLAYLRALLQRYLTEHPPGPDRDAIVKRIGEQIAEVEKGVERDD